MNNIIFSADLNSDLSTFFKANDFSKIAILVDEHTEKHCYPIIKDKIPVHELISIKSGEEQKNLETCSYIWQKMTDFHLDRHSLFVNLGGGVIGDMGGFCAATYKRGIKFIQIPTTLLSQVDASMGGKLGIDFQHYKNHIGVFKDAEKVFIHTPFFKTLPFVELRSGFAEVIKHCLIADKAMWVVIKEKNFEKQDIQALVQHSIKVKSQVVEADPFEKNIRKSLNFGHTIGHAIESHLLNIPGKKLLHGEAIAIGMICESYVSKKLGFISEKELKEIEDFILSIYPSSQIPTDYFEQIIFLTQQDKKNKDAKVLGALLNGIGSIKINVELLPEVITESIEYYLKVGIRSQEPKY